MRNREGDDISEEEELKVLMKKKSRKSAGLDGSSLKGGDTIIKWPRRLFKE